MHAKNREFESQMKEFKEKTSQELQLIKIKSIIENLQFLMNSICISNYEEKLYLFKLLGGRRLLTMLLYRGSKHGWKYKDFHSRCDGKGPTISLFKVKDGNCIGGYTNAFWSSGHLLSVGDSDAMLLNLSC